MKNIKIMKTIMVMLILSLIGSGTPTFAASWQTDGWAKENGHWIYLTNSKKVTGWLDNGGSRYFLTSDGIMQTGQIKIEGYRFIFDNDGKWDGHFYVDSKNPNEVHYDYLNNFDKYGNPIAKTDYNGNAINDTNSNSLSLSSLTERQPQAVVNETLYAHQTTDGWLKTDEGWEYLVNVRKTIGWKQIDGAWYYFDLNGIMLANTIVEGKYRLNANGKWNGETYKAVDYMPSVEEDARNQVEERTKQTNSTATNTNESDNSLSYEEFTRLAEKNMLSLVNAHRQANGSEPLQWDSTLAAMCTEKSKHMIKHNYFDHGYQGYTTSAVQAVAWHHDVDGENILANYSYPMTDTGASAMVKAMFNQWKNSSGHNRAMLDADYKTFGFGFAFSHGKAKYQSYAAQQFSVSGRYSNNITLNAGVPDSLD